MDISNIIIISLLFFINSLLTLLNIFNLLGAHNLFLIPRICGILLYSQVSMLFINNIVDNIASIAAILRPVKDDIAAKTAEDTIKAHKEAMEVELYDE